ncbi:MAG: prepilin-type N-terminal cleavage/methylation domain-containing protein [Eubacteriales bacterium]|nr:prepilin-type N-terminal cleavage/methylation domain-containing protein [Eubacteriales bacterium]
MKKSNKGFSLVELIIVIAIMAILAGALAPALMKYINKTRLASDISAGQTVAKAVQAAMSNETAFNEMKSTFTCSYTATDISAQSGPCFTAECASVCDWTKAVSKAKKDMNGSAITPGNYTVSVDVATNSIVVKLGTGANMYEVYPTPDPALSEKK